MFDIMPHLSKCTASTYILLTQYKIADFVLCDVLYFAIPGMFLECSPHGYQHELFKFLRIL